VLCVQSNKCEVLLYARRVGGACGDNMSGAVGSGGASDPMIHRLSPWTPLITVPEVVVGRFVGSVSPSTSVDRCSRPSRCGRPTFVLCDAPPSLMDA
jgi:hypothetical protein